MLFSLYPYHNFSDYNLDYIIHKIKEINETLNDFINLNTIKYANPIEWNITRQYEQNTVVVDPFDGTAYLSTAPVPSGIGIGNTDYWTPIFNYAEIDSDFANVKNYGAVGDGVTNDTNAFNKAIETGKVVYVPNGEYLVNHVMIDRNCKIIGADNAVIHPLYINKIAQNVFTFKDCDVGTIENIVFSGTPDSGYDLSVMRQSTVEAVNMECFTLNNVTFDSIDNSETSIESLVKNRKGITFTAHDVKHVIFNHVKWNNNSRDEVVWIAPQQYTSIEDIYIDVIDCHSKNHGGWSIINAIANSISVIRFMSESSDNTNGASYMNLLCKNIVIKESYFYGRYLEIIDNRESNAFFGDTVTVEDCYLSGFTSMALILFARQITVNRCYCKGRCLIQCNNAPTSDPSVISAFGEMTYTVYKPIESILVSDSIFDADNSISGARWVAMIYSNNVGGDVNIVRTIYKGNNIAGSPLWLSIVKSLNVKNCTFSGGSNILGSSNIYAYAEIKNDVENINYTGNVADHMLAAILGTGVNKVVLKENIIDSDFTGNIIDNFGSTYKCVSVDSDTNQVRIYADNYTETNASYSTATWKESSTSAFGTELTNRLSLKRGVYFVTCALPVFSSALPVRFRNITANQDFGGIVMGGSYGVINAILNTNVDCEIALCAQGSASVTITNTSNSILTALPVKF